MLVWNALAINNVCYCVFQQFSGHFMNILATVFKYLDLSLNYPMVQYLELFCLLLTRVCTIVSDSCNLYPAATLQREPVSTPPSTPPASVSDGVDAGMECVLHNYKCDGILSISVEHFIHTNQ